MIYLVFLMLPISLLFTSAYGMQEASVAKIDVSKLSPISDQTNEHTVSSEISSSSEEEQIFTSDEIGRLLAMQLCYAILREELDSIRVLLPMSHNRCYWKGKWYAPVTFAKLNKKPKTLCIEINKLIHGKRDE